MSSLCTTSSCVPQSLRESGEISENAGSSRLTLVDMLDELRALLQADWSNFRSNFEDMAQGHFRRQEHLILHWCEDMWHPETGKPASPQRMNFQKSSVSMMCVPPLRSGEHCPHEYFVDEDERTGDEDASITSLSEVVAPLEASLRRIEEGVVKCNDALLGHTKNSKMEGSLGPARCRTSFIEMSEVPAKDADPVWMSSQQSGSNSGMVPKIEAKWPVVHRDLMRSSSSEGSQVEASPKQIEAKLVENTRGFRKGASTGSHSQKQFALKMEHGSVLRRWVYSRCSGLIDKWFELKEPERNSCLARFVDGESFHGLCSMVILINCAVAAHNINSEMATLRDTSSTFWKVTELLFLAFYTTELVLKLLVHRLYFLCNEDMRWNLFDFLLIGFSITDQLLTAVQSKSGTDVTFMRSMRILKMAKILRAVRVMRMFGELRLLMNSLVGSITSLFWSICMLVTVFFIFALIFVQGATTYLITIEDDASNATLVSTKAAFGSVQVAMVTMFMVCTGGEDWKNFFDIISQAGAFHSAIFLFYVAFVQIAVLNILTGVFVENALKLAQPDRETMALEHRKIELEESNALRTICQEIDVTGSGTIKAADFYRQVANDKLKACLQVLGLNINDAQLFFQMLSTTDDEVDIEEFVSGCMKLKGAATSIDMQSVLFQTRLIHRTQQHFFKDCEATLRELVLCESKLQRLLGRIQNHREC